MYEPIYTYIFVDLVQLHLQMKKNRGQISDNWGKREKQKQLFFFARKKGKMIIDCFEKKKEKRNNCLN